MRCSKREDRLLAEKEGILKQEGILKAQEEWIQKIHQSNQERGKEIDELRHLVETRYQQLDSKVEFVLLRLSIKERIRARLFKSLKTTSQDRSQKNEREISV